MSTSNQDLQSPSDLAQSIKTHGYCVISCINADLVPGYRDDMMKEFAASPEFEPEFQVQLYSELISNKCDALESVIGGGFSALSLPSSFHNLSVRSIRKLAHPVIMAVLKHLAPSDDYNFEQVIDRLMIRPKSRKASAEAWHRDIAKKAMEDDIIFGGWINLDSELQYFSCVPGSQLDRTVASENGTGFAPITKSEHKQLKTKSKQVTVQPGGILVFNESLIHELKSMKHTNNVYRLFLGWRLTKYKTPLDPIIFEKLEKQGVITIKSNQIPALYPSTYVNYPKFHPLLRKLGLGYKKQLLRPKIINVTVNKETKQKKQEHFYIPDRHMKSLAEYNLPLYPAYSPTEMAMHVPQPF